MPLGHGGQCAFQVSSDIALRQPTGDGEPENLPTNLLYAMCRVHGAAGLDYLDSGQDVSRADLGNGACAQGRKEIVFEPGSNLLLGRSRALSGGLGKPLAGDGFESVEGGVGLCDSVIAFCFTRIDVFRQQLARFVAALPGLGQGHSVVDTEG